MKLLSFLIVGLVLIAGYLVYDVSNTPVLKQDFIINRGDTITSLPKKLSIDVNSMFYRIYTKIFIKNFTLQAGTYSIDKDTTLSSLLSEVLKKPVSKDITITIFPGWNIWDIDFYLTKEGIVKDGDFLTKAKNVTDAMRKKYPFLGKATSLEGFLMPDTYRIGAESKADDIIKILLEAFDSKVYQEFSFSSNTEFYKTLIFASILEKEEKSSVNKPVVAGILQKRYLEKIAIGADATVCYAYDLTMTDCTPAFIGAHIFEENAYNTRRALTLPPTPISNPSVDTIRATIESQPSKYYYYLHDNDGVIHYGKTLEEHNMNRVKYLGK